MMLTVIVLSSTLLSITLIGGLIMLYQIRHAGDFSNSGKAIFAADSGVNWWSYYNSGSYSPSNNSGTINAAFKNGASFTIEDIAANKVKIIGKAGSSKRALLFESFLLPGLIPCNEPIDLIILVDDSSSMSANLSLVKTAIKNFLDKLGVGPTQAHVGLVLTSDVLFQHLSDNLESTKNNVDSIAALSTDNSTLTDSIEKSQCELDDPPLAGCGDGHDRPDDRAPDFIIIITDDLPNTPLPDPLITAEQAATDAKTQGKIKILTAYGGTVQEAIDFYSNKIVSSPSSTHFYASDSFDTVVPLEKMLVCK